MSTKSNHRLIGSGLLRLLATMLTFQELLRFSSWQATELPPSQKEVFIQDFDQCTAQLAAHIQELGVLIPSEPHVIANLSSFGSIHSVARKGAHQVSLSRCVRQLQSDITSLQVILPLDDDATESIGVLTSLLDVCDRLRSECS